MNRLAIKGGTPVRKTFLPYGHQWIEDDDINALTEALKTDWITQGPKISEFEEKVAEYCGAKYAVAVCNGTAALHAACAAAGISEGDEAITSPITFAATANSIVYCGGKPIFADIQEDTQNIDPKQIAKKISPKTKAILPVDFAGHPCDIDEIKHIAKKGGLVLIEDAAHALGADYKDFKVGSLADMTILSFHPVKQITTGEGGMVLTNNKEFHESLKVFRHHGIVRDAGNLSKVDGPWYYEINNPGYNYRITDFQCALGLSQFSKLDRFVQRRREIADAYNQAFSEIDEIIIPTEKSHVRSAYHIYVIQLNTGLLTVGRKEVFEALRAENIGVNVHYIPVHLLPYYQNRFMYHKGDYPVAEQYYNRAVTLPIFPKMSDEDIRDVIKAVTKVIEYYRENKSNS